MQALLQTPNQHLRPNWGQQLGEVGNGGPRSNQYAWGGTLVQYGAVVERLIIQGLQ